MTGEFASYLLSVALASSAGILPVLLVRRTVRRLFGSACGYALWLLLPVAMFTVLLPHTASSVSTWNIQPVAALNHALEGRQSAWVAGAPLSAPTAATDWPALTVGFWAMGAVLFGAYLVVQQRAFLRTLGPRTGSRRVLRVERSDCGPAVVGVFRPKILLPGNFRACYTPLERLLIVSHERTHLRRGDAFWNALVALLRCALWFNPLVHLASMCFRMDQEFACDAAVIRNYPESRRAYANALLKTHLAGLMSPVGCHWGSAQGLKDRVQMLKSGLPSRTRRRCGAALIVLLSAVVGCTTWSARPATNGPVSAAAPEVRHDLPTPGTAPVLNSVTGFILDVRDGRLFLPPAQTMEWNADRVVVAPNSMMVQEHLQMRISSPGDGEARAHTMILDTNRAILSKQTDGGSVVQFDQGTIKVTLAAQSAPGSPQHQHARTAFSIIPNFRDADLRLVAKAVHTATNRSFMIDPGVHAQVTMVMATPMTPEAFYQAFLVIVQVYGLSAIPAGGVIQIVPNPKASYLRDERVPLRE